MKRHVFALGLTVLLAACGGTRNQGLETVHQPVVSRTDYVFDVRGGSLSAYEQQQLDGWFRSLDLRYGDRVSVDGADSLSRDSVQEVAGRYGLLVETNAPVTQGEIQPGMVRVVVSRGVASVPGCPDWSRLAQPDFGNHTMSNFGCATMTNLAAMVANPDDLIQGRSGSSATDAQTVSKAIRTYRSQPATGSQGLKNESTKGGQ